MIKHKHTHNLVLIVVIVSILICIGGIFTGLITQEYEDLKNDPKIEADIVDMIQDEGSAEIIIELKSSSGSREIQSDIPEFEINYEYSNFNSVSGEVDKDILKSLAGNSQVEKIYLNKKYKINLDESIPLIKADEVHEAERLNIELKGEGYSVCVIDTGVNYNHPALIGRVISGYDFVNNDSDPVDDNGHGTHVSGIIASNDTTYTGVAPKAKIVAIKACDSNGDCEGADILAGIDWCIGNASLYNITVISMSLGDDGEYNSGTCPSDFDNSIDSAINNGIFVTISSGNNGHESGISSPSCSPNATSVGATDKSDNLWGGSNTGDLLDLLAPGVDIQSSILGSSFGEKDGTSMANAHVAGAAILLYQNKNLSGESITPLEIRDQLKNNGVNISGFPRLDVKEAVLTSRIELSYEISPYPKTNANTYFYANYTNKTDNASIDTGNCSIRFNDSYSSMDFNSSIEVFQYNRSFTSPATYSYNITCNDSSFETLVETDSIEVVQGSENCTYPGSNIDWNLSGSDFSRCVGENLVINQSNINIKDNAEFVLKDTNITLVDAAIDYVINITGNGNLTLNNISLKGYSSSETMDLEIHGYAQIYNSTFEYSRVKIYGNKNNAIENSIFKDEFYTNEFSDTSIYNSNFQDDSYFEDNSIVSLTDCEFQGMIYLREDAKINSDNLSSSTWIFMEDDSIFNASEFTNLSDSSFSVENSPTIYGKIDMPTTTNVFAGINATRYFPVYVYYNDGITPYPNREIKVINSTGGIIWQGNTNSQGYIEAINSFSDSDYVLGNFNVTTNENKDLYLFMDAPITLEVSEDPPGGDGGSPDGGSSSDCVEDWNCTDWGACVNGTQNRACTDLNECDTIYDKPNETRVCFIPKNSNSGKLNTDQTEYHITANTESGSKIGKDCCLIGICWFRYIICWYWWLLIIAIIIFDLIVIWRMKSKRKKKRQKALMKAFGIDWAIKKSGL